MTSRLADRSPPLGGAVDALVPELAGVLGPETVGEVLDLLLPELLAAPARADADLPRRACP